MAFTRKRINVTFEMDGVPAKTLTGKRVSARIVNAGDPSLAQAEVAIYGMTLSDMNTLSTIGTQLNQASKNFMSIYAGDDESGLKLVYQGTIYMAWMDGQAQPEVPFRVVGIAGYYQAVESAPPTSVQGTADVDQIFTHLAAQMGMVYEGKTGIKVSNPYLPGSPLEQVRRLAQAAGVTWTIENNTLVVTKPGTPRVNSGNVTLSPETGLVGYPSFNQAAIVARSYFNSDLKLLGQVTLKSQIQPANGTWNIVNLVHEIESEMPDGAWFSIVTMTTVGGQADTSGSAF